MSHAEIDFSKLVTADDVRLGELADHVNAVKTDCRDRIFAVADATTQMNLAAAAAGGLLGNDQMEVYRAGLAWVADMQAACRKMAADIGADYGDKSWPPVPDGVEDLVSKF